MAQPGRRWTTLAGRLEPPRPRADDGLTLIELVIAVTVFAILAGAVAEVASSGLSLARNNRDRSIAANLASEDMDAVQQMDFSALAAQINTSIPVRDRTVGSVTYHVHRTVQWESASSGTSICDYTAGGSTSSWVVGVHTSVDWPAKPSVMPSASASTVISPPVGVSVNSNRATVPVTVHDRNGNAASNVSVFATDGGMNNYTGTTNGNGCAFLIVVPSTYTLTLNTANYVDRTGNPTPSRTFSISLGGNVPITFDYDVKGSLTLTASTPSGVNPPSNVPLTLAYQFFQPSGTEVFSGTGFPVTVSGLFPDAYEFWAGDCADADPQSSSWSGARDGSVTAPGSGTISLGEVHVTATASGTGLPVSGATVVATHNDGVWGSCPVGSPSAIGYALGTTDATGSLTGALPWGHWKITVTPVAGAPASTTVAVDPKVDPATFAAAVTL